MRKSKLGISVGLMAAALYLITGFGGYTAALLVTGYILLREEDLWLKKEAVKSVGVLILFSLVSWLISLVPNLFNLISDFVNLFKGNFYPEIMYRIFNFLTSCWSLAKGILFVYLSLQALKKKSVTVPVLDPLLENLFNNDAE